MVATEVKLKERCHSCDGQGIYRWGESERWEQRCWTCDGKGWVTRMMRRPSGVPKAGVTRKVESR
jgi:DnaJ-class molecular chaperone